MSDVYDKMKELISKLGDEETKKSMDSLLSELNKEKGTALNDLKTIKERSKTLENDVKTMAELTKILKDKGFEAKSPTDLIEIAKTLNIPTDDKATHDAYKQLIEETNAKLLATESALKEFKAKEILLPKLQQAMNDFKDKDGKPVKFIDSFIDKNVLIKDTDISNEVLVNAKIKNILEDGLNKQNIFLTENGLQIPGTPLHNVNLPNQGITNGKGVTFEEQHKFFKENGGNVDAAAKLFAHLEQTNKV